MGFNRKEPPATIDLFLKQGSDLSETITWSADGVPVDFTGATARLAIIDDCIGLELLITTTASPYGGVVLSTGGNIGITIAKAATQVIRSMRSPFNFYVDWPGGTSTCLFGGTLYLSPGSPY